MRDEQWRSAASNEINAMIQNDTWDLVPPASNRNVVGCRWVFTIKYLPNGLIDMYKARLVSKGFHQQQGLDYYECIYIN